MIIYLLLSLLFYITGVQVISTHTQEVNMNQKHNTKFNKISVLDFKTANEADADFVYSMKNKISNDQKKEKVKLQVYYECLCPHCRRFAEEELQPTVQKLNQFLDVYLYPYGNANTTVHDGHYEFECQHGIEECYGNKLHACAIDALRNATISITFNVCMMNFSQETHGSDDAAADVCGKSMDIDSDPIKQCAKGDKGTHFLKYYGEESKRANVQYVPYVLINGVIYTYEGEENRLLKAVCARLIQPPPQCEETKSKRNINV